MTRSKVSVPSYDSSSEESRPSTPVTPGRNDDSLDTSVAQFFPLGVNVEQQSQDSLDMDDEPLNLPLDMDDAGQQSQDMPPVQQPVRGPGRGKEGVVRRPGLGKGGARRLRNTEKVEGISRQSIRRLARRGGVKRISGLVYAETRTVLKEFLAKVLRDTVSYLECARRKTVTAMDVVYALKRMGRTLYGFHNPEEKKKK